MSNWVDGGATYQKEEDCRKNRIAQGNDREVGWGEGIRGPALAMVHLRDLPGFFNYLLQLGNNITMTKTESPPSREVTSLVGEKNEYIKKELQVLFEKDNRKAWRKE